MYIFFQPIIDGSNVWNINFDDPMGNPAEWNSIQKQFNDAPDGETLMYIPVSTKSQQMYIKPPTANNFNQKPNRVTINRLPIPPKVQYRQSPKVVRPTAETHNVPRQTYSHQPSHESYRSHQLYQQHQHDQSIINHGSLGSHNFEEYLLHAQMPLPNAKTFVLSNIADNTEPEFLT